MPVIHVIILRHLFYGKIYWSWDKAGTSAAFRLKDWLDPIESGDTVCDGIPLEPIPPEADFMAGATSINQGDEVQFSDLSSNKPQQWMWILEGAEEDTMYIKNPVATYYEPGYHDVTLIVETPMEQISLQWKIISMWKVLPLLLLNLDRILL